MLFLGTELHSVGVGDYIRVRVRRSADAVTESLIQLSSDCHILPVALIASKSDYIRIRDWCQFGDCHCQTRSQS